LILWPIFVSNTGIFSNHHENCANRSVKISGSRNATRSNHDMPTPKVRVIYRKLHAAYRTPCSSKRRTGSKLRPTCMHIQHVPDIVEDFPPPFCVYPHPSPMQTPSVCNATTTSSCANIPRYQRKRRKIANAIPHYKYTYSIT
jgi:hypothetical protein